MCHILGSQDFVLWSEGQKLVERFKGEKKDYFVLGQSFATQDVNEAIYKRLKRDYPEIPDENFGAIFVPESYIPKAPQVIDPELECESKDKDVIGNWRKIKGDLIERKCYDALKNVFENRGENALIISQLEINLSENSKNKLEIDFLVVNLTKKYLWNIECKRWLGDVKELGPNGKPKPKSFKKAIDQIQKNKENLEKWFGGDLKTPWKFLGSAFCDKFELDAHQCEKNCQDFIARNEKELQQILKIFEIENQLLSSNDDLSRQDFVLFR